MYYRELLGHLMAEEFSLSYPKYVSRRNKETLQESNARHNML